MNQDPNVLLENEFIEAAKELTAKTKNPKWSIKAAQTIRDMKDLYKSASDPDDMVAYKMAEIKYKKNIDYELGK